MKDNKKAIWGWTIAVVVFIVIVFILFLKPVEKQSSIRIGVITPLSGDAAIYGESLKGGLDLAAEEINQSGVLNRQIELLYEDSHLDSKTAIGAFNKFVNVDNLDIIILAEGSGATSAVVPLADQTKTLVMIPIASADSLKTAGDYVFRVIPSDSYRGIELGKLIKTLGAKTAAIFYVNDAYGTGIKDTISDSFTTLGGKILVIESFSNGDTDYRSQLIKIKTQKPDILVVAARKEFPIIIKQKNDIGLSVPVIASEVIDESILKESAQDMTGILTLDFQPAKDYANFKIAYQTKYKKDAPLYSDYGYDSLAIIVQAIKETRSTDATKLKNELYKIDYRGATGEIKFDQYGEVTAKPMIQMIIEDGRFIEKI